MTLLRHYTKPHYVGKIITDGFIEFQTRATSVKELRKEEKRVSEFYGVNLKRTRAELQLQILGNKTAARTTGTWVWLTEDNFCATANGNTDSSELYFEFDSADICAKRWIDVKSTFKGKAAIHAAALDSAARMMGDNPSKYWVCKNKIPLKFAQPSEAIMRVLVKAYDAHIAKNAQLREAA
jgi:hypothetical protein